MMQSSIACASLKRGNRTLFIPGTVPDWDGKEMDCIHRPTQVLDTCQSMIHTASGLNEMDKTGGERYVDMCVWTDHSQAGTRGRPGPRHTVVSDTGRECSC